MIPVVTPDEMAGVDRSAPEPGDVLVARAGAAVVRNVVAMIRASPRRLVYGARVVVVAGPGNNGADGRDAARRLVARGAAVTVVDASRVVGATLPPADLVIDAAFGTGLSRPYRPPVPVADLGSAPVLAVDLPSGVSGLTGEVVGGDDGGFVRAARTVTFAALKPGLVLGVGPDAVGELDVADIGLGGGVDDVARAWMITDADVARIPARGNDAHKWQSAVHVVAGSPGMNGAPWLVSTAALRAGAGYVRLGIPGVEAGAAGLPPGEVVNVGLPVEDWPHAVLDGLERFSCLVVGPGLGAGGRSADGSSGPDTPVGRLLSAAPIPAVADADGLNALGSIAAVAAVTSRRSSSGGRPLVLTPHVGEFARLTGEPPGPDRVASVRAAASRCGAIVLLKGSTTVVAHPDGRVLLANSGSSRLATAGTGDVLSGVIGALVARGVEPFEAAALGAHVHGRAAGRGWAQGLVASDLPDLVAGWLSDVGRPWA
ncbi:MAG: NAD(P)H-hydrate dehydratase [Actinomycetota bacterium]|nr:NAD(P)H-hydrate dehydratase [Actinomycetota bacterium]